MAGSRPRRTLPVRRSAGNPAESATGGEAPPPASSPDGLIAPEPSVESLARIGDDTADALTVYLRRIRRTELFTPEQEYATACAAR